MSQEKKTDGSERSKMNVIWFFIKPYKLRVFVLFALFLLMSSLEAATIAAIYPILNAAFSPGMGEKNYILSLFQTLAELLPVSDIFISYCIVFILFAVLTFIIKYIAVSFRTRFISHLVAEKQNEIFRKLIRADYQYFVEHKQGELLYVTITAPHQLSTLVSSVTEFVSQMLLSISVFLLLFSLSWTGAAGVLVMGIGYIFLSRYLGKHISYQASQQELEAIKESNIVFNESISGIKQIKVFASGDNWADRFGRAIAKRWDNTVKRGIWQQIPPMILLLVLYLAVAVVVLLIKIYNPTGYLELVPVFGAFAFAVFRLIPFVSSIGTTAMYIQSSLPDCEAMYNVLIENLTHVINGNVELETFNDEIVFKDVTFAYKKRSETLKNFSIVLKKGKTTAIVGRSGSGKTTIISLLLRLFDVDEGEIKIDGKNIKEYKIESWLHHVGYVSQDTFILNDTIEKNITFNSEGYTKEQVITAAKYADAHGFISELPEGYDTVVGDKGMRLSGGQAQRIAVARAMIRNPEILIFDEATNNLDNISELAVQKAIEKIATDHTVILVAHRLSTIVNADKILVIEKGSLEEVGNHNELMQKKGAYWRLYQRQSE